MKTKCENCGKRLYGFELEDMILAEQEYREHFPRSWHFGKRILVCDDCFIKLEQEEPPQAWDARQDPE